jgi:hypothetical protein
MKEEIENGEHFLVEDETKIEDYQNFTSRSDWNRALKAAKKVEKKHGIENLGPYSDFDWGMINGKLSAIRWTLGDDWDQLDT